jgi:SAM-dependent methyltransferase
MFGIPGEYPYMECTQCGVLVQQDVPHDISHYYPGDYYSYNPPPISPIKRYLKRERVRYGLTGRSIVGRIATKKWGAPELVNWIKSSGVKEESRILDVGCGSGAILREFEIAGFKNLFGIDPFIPADLRDGNIDIRKRDIADEDRTFDLIMFHHSFEHVRDPLATLQAAHRCLSPIGTLLIRTPVAQTYAWRNFGRDWFQLEAPRHLFIHSVESLRILAKRTGFELVQTTFDSSDFMFWTSIQVQNGIPLRGSNSYDVDPAASMFSSEEIAKFKAHADQLNADHDGDAAAFYFRKGKS